ncbi:MAG: tRNA (N(6)-L-threonylcarbamoyladenosine(37)-C(2))-methylthiotransferase MtaB [Desulfobulbaceae bacterium]|uniref:tRNA (N(6)-L-threonylcarbamoyladenosine(37)-C(2))-methylthiotransferase MtaB n=1 Tax=Candidatus Desulfatifera sulfidica TaxID=2841691 RepID=A0A8J6NBA2_9BACT|nr:tRNA (N(6)-L-threonylcarbamoyladenosine(37)-C(2))-methylthiotransferase MtaB [Candidatus Desulfatifera sulfidica]
MTNEKNKVLISTLGCKVNQFESAAFQSAFEAAGCSMAGRGEEADILVINTCAVTTKAGAQSRKTVRQLMRRHPQARLVITGCYAQLAGQELIELSDRPICIVGNGNKDKLVTATLNPAPCELTMLTGKIRHNKEICHLEIQRFSERTRAYLRVQDGCDNFCTYCIVPYTRGTSRSLPLDKVIHQARIFDKQDHREIVVTGIHVGQYGRDLAGNTPIHQLLRELCRATPDVRYRLSSIEPLEVSDELLHVMAEETNFMPHFHIPLQSGDDHILKRMNRHYNGSQFLAVTRRCLEILPDAALGIDVLTGFPGESEEQFHNTVELLKLSGCSYLHVFPYSRRPGTPAAEFKDQIPGPVKDKRVAILRSLGEQQKQTFYQRHLGSTRPVLVERRRKRGGPLNGFTDNYIPVSFDGPDELINCVVFVSLDQLSNEEVLGTYRKTTEQQEPPHAC